MSMSNIARCFMALMLFSFVMGCQRKWCFTITNSSDPTHPEFCFGVLDKCRGDGINFAALDVWEVNQQEELVRKVWSLEATSNEKMKIVTYGKTPKGYQENLAALPLEMGKYYSVLGVYYFRFIQEGNTVIPQIFKYGLTDKIE